MNASRPKLLIVAGANGAGKSTLTKRWTRRLNRLGPVLDPDEIAKGIDPIHPSLAGIQAALTKLLVLKYWLPNRAHGTNLEEA